MCVNKAGTEFYIYEVCILAWQTPPSPKLKELNYKIYLESVKKTVFSSLSMRMITAAFTNKACDIEGRVDGDEVVDYIEI